MIISRTPFRISFFGGGTDYPEWYMCHGGAVLATSINKYCYISCRYLPPFFKHRFRIVYSNSEVVQTIEEIAHPAVREVLKYLGLNRGLEIHHDGDLPARSGVGSSSAFTVGLFNALFALRGQMPSKWQLARDSIHVERERLHEAVGSQDQVLAAYGGFNHITFDPSGDIIVRPMTVSADRVDLLNSQLMLFFTGIHRTASDIARTYLHDLSPREAQLRRMHQMTDEGVAIVASGDLRDFGRLLHESWQAKRGLSAHVTTGEVDEIYHEARAAGALGGKLLGAGGGGFMVLFVETAHQRDVRERLRRLIHVPFRFEKNGSQIIFCEPEEDYASQDRHRAGEATETDPYVVRLQRRQMGV